MMLKLLLATAAVLIGLSSTLVGQAADTTSMPDSSIVWHRLHAIGGLGFTFTDPARLSRRFSFGYDNYALSLNRIDPPERPSISNQAPPTDYSTKKIPRTVYGFDLAISTPVLPWLELFASAGPYWNDYTSLAYSQGTYYLLEEGNEFHIAVGFGSYVEINGIPTQFNFLALGAELNSMRGLTGLFGIGWRFSSRK